MVYKLMFDNVYYCTNLLLYKIYEIKKSYRLLLNWGLLSLFTLCLLWVSLGSALGQLWVCH